MSHLTDTQLIILAAAAQRVDGCILLPERLRGGAATKVLTTLAAKGLIDPADPETRCRGLPTEGLTDYRIATRGLAALGLADERSDDPQQVAGRQAPPRHLGQKAQPTRVIPEQRASEPEVTDGCPEAPQPRAGSKQGQLITMLSRDDGASIVEIATALGWLPHTTRAALTGLRHKGYELGREINAERGSIYRVTAMPIMAPAATDAVQAEAA